MIKLGENKDKMNITFADPFYNFLCLIPTFDF